MRSSRDVRGAAASAAMPGAVQALLLCDGKSRKEFGQCAW